MNSGRWIDVELKEALSDSNHPEFIRALTDATNKIVADESMLTRAYGERSGVRIILPNKPDSNTTDVLSFICAGFKHHGIPLKVVFKSEQSFEEIVLPESIVFNNLLKRFKDK